MMVQHDTNENANRGRRKQLTADDFATSHQTIDRQLFPRASKALMRIQQVLNQVFTRPGILVLRSISIPFLDLAGHLQSSIGRD